MHRFSGAASLFGLGALVLADCAPIRTKHPPVHPAGIPPQVDGDPIVFMAQRDAFVSIDEPRFLSAAEADALLDEKTPVLGVARGSEARAYPIRLLDDTEIVNDTLARTPIAATW